MELLDGTIYIPKDDFINKSHQRIYFKIGNKEFDVLTLYDSENSTGFFPNEIMATKKELIRIDLPKYAFIKFVKYEILNEFGENIGLVPTIMDVTTTKFFNISLIKTGNTYIEDGSYLIKFSVGSVNDYFKEVKVVKLIIRLDRISIGKTTVDVDKKNRNTIILE